MARKYPISRKNTLSDINPLSTNFTKWSNTLKQFVGKLPTNCLSVFDHFVGLALKGLTPAESYKQLVTDFENSSVFLSSLTQNAHLVHQ